MPQPQADTLEPKTRNLRDAVAAYSGLQGVNALTLSTSVERITALLVRKWDHLVEVAYDQLADENVTVAFSVKLDFSPRMPRGQVRMSFRPAAISDEVQFNVEDPAELLPLQTARGTPPSPSPTPTPAAHEPAAGTRARTVRSRPLQPLPNPTVHPMPSPDA